MKHTGKPYSGEPTVRFDVEGSGGILTFTLPTFITSDPGHKRREKPDMVDPELPPVQADNNVPATKKEIKEAKKLASQLERVNMLKIGDEWKVSEIPKQTRTVMEKLDLHIMQENGS